MIRVRDPQSGVALLETMIALLVMAMAAVAIASTFAILGQVGTRAGEDQQRMDLLLAQNRLVSWAETIPPRLENTQDILLEGDARRLRFYSVDGSGTYAKEHAILIEVALAGSRIEATPQVRDSRPLVLAVDVKELNFQYWGKARQSDPADWHDRWNSAPFLPELIKVKWQDQAGFAQVPLLLEPSLQNRRSHRSLSTLVPRE